MPAILPKKLDAHIKEYERRIIVRAISESRHNATAAARRLGITFRALRYRAADLGITYRE